MQKKYVEGKECFEVTRIRDVKDIMCFTAQEITDYHMPFLSDRAVNQESAEDIICLAIQMFSKELLKRGMLIKYK